MLVNSLFKRSTKVSKGLLLFLLAASLLFSLLGCGATLGDSGEGLIGKPSDEEKLPPGPDPVEELLTQASFIAAGYDYDKALELIYSYKGYESNDKLTNAIESFTKAKEYLVRYPNPETITHIFFHSLIVDNDRAFDGDSKEAGYNLYMNTVEEFKRILKQMYDRNYVLVNIYDMVKEITLEDGSKKFVEGDIMLPEGKIPFVMSQDDVNYYEYMVDSDNDRFADAGGDGFATKIVLGEDGYPTCEYITKDGQVVTGDYDLVPILEAFIQEHPDFSYRGARAILGVTGYEGVLGYKTHPDFKEILGKEAYEKEIEEAKKVSQALKDHGWIIASHSFGHPAYGSISTAKLLSDVNRWEEQVQPIVGDADILLYPFGSDIGGIGKYSGEKFSILQQAGYKYFCNVDSAKHWVQIHDSYVRQGRRNLDGYRLYWGPHLLEDLFNPSEIIDKARTLPVPKL